MSGIKGKSGRKSNFAKAQEGKLEDMCTQWLRDNFNEFDESTQIKVALLISSKAVTQKQDITTTLKDSELAEQINSFNATKNRLLSN